MKLDTILTNVKFEYYCQVERLPGSATVSQPHALLKTLPIGFLRSLIAAQNTHAASQYDVI